MGEVILPDREDFAKSAKKQTFLLALLVENPFIFPGLYDQNIKLFNVNEGLTIVSMTTQVCGFFREIIFLEKKFKLVEKKHQKLKIREIFMKRL